MTLEDWLILYLWAACFDSRLCKHGAFDREAFIARQNFLLRLPPLRFPE